MKKERTIGRNTGFILLGTAILSFGMYNFNYQHDITEGGILGLLLLLKNLFDIEPSKANLLIDTALFLVAYKYFGNKFLINSIIATVSFSIYYSIFENIGPVFPNMDNKLIGTILAGLFVGIGVGIVVRNEAAAGGDDALALVVSKFTSITMGKFYLISDVTILIMSLSYLSIKDVLWSLIAVNISGRTIDYVSNFKINKVISCNENS